ncbi:hypothetical protein PMAYCL1PPCAC_00583, partial [Pristionchus mayeri]
RRALRQSGPKSVRRRRTPPLFSFSSITTGSEWAHFFCYPYPSRKSITRSRGVPSLSAGMPEVLSGGRRSSVDSVCHEVSLTCSSLCSSKSPLLSVHHRRMSIRRSRRERRPFVRRRPSVRGGADTRRSLQPVDRSRSGKRREALLWLLTSSGLVFHRRREPADRGCVQSRKRCA